MKLSINLNIEIEGNSIEDCLELAQNECVQINIRNDYNARVIGAYKEVAALEWKELERNEIKNTLGKYVL